MMKRTLLAGFILTAILFGSIYFFVRNRIKTGIISTLFLLLIFNYGIFYDLIESMYFAGYWPFHNIHRYLIGLMVATCIFIFYIVQKKIVIGYGINYFLNILVIILILFNALQILNLESNHSKVKFTSEKFKHPNRSSKLPNIYYIILDGYANQHILKKYYNFDNSEFIGFLERNGFFIADSSISNYYSTPPSLAATLNMEYLKESSSLQIRSQVLNNKLLPVLKHNGYTIYNLQSGYSVTNGFSGVDSTIKIYGPNEFERGILKFTIFRLDDLFGMIQYVRLKSQFEKLNAIATIKNNQKFTFVHIVAPHPPFVFNSKGEHMYNQKHSENSWEPKKSYVEQLIYVNKMIAPFLSKIIDFDPEAVVIVQSDHGPWIQTENKSAVFEARSMILNGMRFPGKKDSLFKKSISSVNTFRLFIKAYLDPSFTLLKDSAAGKKDIMSDKIFTDRTN